MKLTTIPKKVGLTLLAVYWCVMLGMVIYAQSSRDSKPGACATRRFDSAPFHLSSLGEELVSTVQVNSFKSEQHRKIRAH